MNNNNLKQRIAAASKLVDRGVTMKEAAEVMQVTYNQLNVYRKENETVSRRNVFTVAERIDAVRRMINGESPQVIAEDIGAARKSLYRWKEQHDAGILTLSNAVAVRSVPPVKPEPVEQYVIDGQSFGSIEECKKYAVEKLGGITLTRTVTETIKL